MYDVEKIPTANDYSDMSAWIIDGEEYSEKEVKEWLKDSGIEFTEDNWEEVAEENDSYKWWYLERPRFQGVFLTRKSAQEFIDSNHYHFDKPYIYVHSLWRNYEMQGVRELLLNGCTASKPKTK